jgi:hypothetical protein
VYLYTQGSALSRIHRPSTTSVPPHRTRGSKSFLIFILLQRRIFPRCPELPRELVIYILEEAGFYRCTAVSSWKWPAKFDRFHPIGSFFQSKWPVCLSNHSPVHGPGLHPLKSITIRWQWNRRKPSDSKPHVYLYLVPADRGRDSIPGQRIDIAERLPLQYHKILRTEGIITVNQYHPIIANAQPGDAVCVVFYVSADPREVTIRYFCAW